jgi:hypothetical protein
VGDFHPIDLPRLVMDSLRGHIKTFRRDAAPKAILFPSRAGTHRHETNVNTTFRQPARKLNLDVCVYDLKRFALKFLVEVGPRYAQEQAPRTPRRDKLSTDRSRIRRSVAEIRPGC